ncbi:MAG: acyl dehydratase [Acidimicrobiia bacterium]|nr:acyl dehydratase [Acidimicrobiia bacterium]
MPLLRKVVTVVEVWAAEAPRIGDVAEMSREVSVRDIEVFTELSGDRNPLHYDQDIAASTPFGEIIVQGGVTTAILNAVVAEQLPGPGSVFLQLDLRFLAPVRPGDTITGAVVVTGVRRDKPIANLDVRVTRDDDTCAVEGTAVTYTAAIGRPVQGSVSTK